MEAHRSVAQFPEFAWLAACCLAVLVVTFGAPRMALASTPLGGSYSTASDAAAAVCGYDWDDLPSDVRQKCMADQLRGFSRFRNTLTNSALDVTVWTSSADGMLYATLVDNARADLRDAIAQSNGVGGDGGNFTNYNNNQNNPSGNTGTGGESGGSSGDGSKVIHFTRYTTANSNNTAVYYYQQRDSAHYSYFSNEDLAKRTIGDCNLTISGGLLDTIEQYADAYGKVLLLLGFNNNPIDYRTSDVRLCMYTAPNFDERITPLKKNYTRGDSTYEGIYGFDISTGTYYYFRDKKITDSDISTTISSEPFNVTCGDSYNGVVSVNSATTSYGTGASRAGYVNMWYCILNGDGTVTSVPVGNENGGSGGTDGDTYVYSPTTYNNNSNTTNVTNNTTTTTNNTTNTTVNDTTNNTTYNYTTVIQGTQDIDMTPITARLDALNAMVGNLGIDVQSIGSDLRSLDAEVASFHTDFARFGDWLYNLWQGLNGTLSRIIGRLDLIDEDINALDFGGGSSSGGSVDVDMTDTNDLLQDIADKLDALNSLMAINTAANVLDAVLDLLDDLLDAIGGVLDTLADAFGELTDVFPFSIPWDLAIIGGLLVHEPVTPVLDIALPRMGAQAVSIHVDLSAWNGAAEIARGCELILFGVGLALNTREMMGIGDDVA